MRTPPISSSPPFSFSSFWRGGDRLGVLVVMVAMVAAAAVVSAKPMKWHAQISTKQHII